MKKAIVLATVFCALLLTACTPSDEERGTEKSESESARQNLSSENLKDEQLDDEIRDILSSLDPIPFLMRHEEWEEDRWRIELLLIDLVTGETLASYEFDEADNFRIFGDLGDGYYAVQVWETDAELFDDIEHRVVIFNHNLDVVDTIFYDAEIISIFSGFLELINGELIGYSFEAGEREIRPAHNPIRFNLHTGEIEVLAEIDEPIQGLYQFVGENQMFVTDKITLWDEGSITSRYGILDLETETTHLFEQENFSYDYLDFSSDHVLISESLSVGPPLSSKVILFHFESMSSEALELEGEESVWARLSFDGNHLVTVNSDASVFRKYDFNGNIVAEVETELLATERELHASATEYLISFEWFEAETAEYELLSFFEIYPITEYIYGIHTLSTFDGYGIQLSEHHFQVVVLP